jgi:hypothetical protein
MPGAIRQEFIIAGCLLAAVGFIAVVIGFDQVQDSPLESAVSLIENLSGSPAPPGLHPAKTGAYVVLIGGLVALATGITLILKSRRTKPSDAAGGYVPRSGKP